MIRLIRAELIKLRTTQVWFWLLVATLALGALTIIGPIASDPTIGPSDVAGLFGNAATAYIAVFVLGVLILTTEYRYQTITPTLLTTPKRWQVVIAKGLTMIVVGAVYALLTVLIQVAIGIPWLAARGVDISATGPDGVLVPVVKAFVVVVLYGLLGFGFGALTRNQIVGVVVGVVYVVILENLVVAIPGVKHAFPYLPGGGAASIGGAESINGVDLLPLWGGVAILVGWTVVLVVAGLSTSLRRDIT